MLNLYEACCHAVWVAHFMGSIQHCIWVLCASPASLPADLLAVLLLVLLLHVDLWQAEQCSIRSNRLPGSGVCGAVHGRVALLASPQLPVHHASLCRSHCHRADVHTGGTQQAVTHDKHAPWHYTLHTSLTVGRGVLISTKAAHELLYAARTNRC